MSCTRKRGSRLQLLEYLPLILKFTESYLWWNSRITSPNIADSLATRRYCGVAQGLTEQVRGSECENVVKQHVCKATNYEHDELILSYSKLYTHRDKKKEGS